MKSRRNFIQQGGIATLALLATKPFKTFANSTFNTSGVSLNDNTIALVHNANTKKHQHIIAKKITQIKSNTNNLVLLETGKPVDAYTTINSDVAVQNELATTLTNDSYKIIYKGDINIPLSIFYHFSGLSDLNTGCFMSAGSNNRPG